MTDTDRIRFNVTHDGRAIAKAAGAQFNVDVDVSICRVRGLEQLTTRLGGVIFTNFTGESIGIHSASWYPRWVNRDMLFVTFDYPFNQLGVARIFGQVPEDNVDALRFNTNLGFRPVARVEGVYRNGIACIVMCMEREECRFLSIKPRCIQSNKGINNGWQIGPSGPARLLGAS